MIDSIKYQRDRWVRLAIEAWGRKEDEVTHLANTIEHDTREEYGGADEYIKANGKEDRNNEITEMKNSGLSVDVIAKKTGLSKNHVYRILRG